MRISRDRMSEWNLGIKGQGLSLLIPQRDYSGMNKQEEQLRVWLPDPAKIGLAEICEHAEISMTVYVTEYFTEYLYGRHELLRMRAKRSGLYEPVPLSGTVKYNRERTAADMPPSLGKSIFALKFFVPAKIKSDLQALANRAQISLGEFNRALICAHLFGREYGPQLLLAVPAQEKHVGDLWENKIETS
ncbi:MAG: hypothetical protein KKH74_08970 [Gammaproteobacteria bacterium]|nr:hypothetical protein [Gammaproteobacteria bacterium]MBU1732641.1 hypothetical protein [Gammaproteobacteria bacterium]MBU1893504.1 hypothetical protein [Gammaproteobacteria bacterium]